MVEALFLVTMYCPGPGGTALTASGTHPREGRTIAADPALLPAGTPVMVFGLGPRVVEDTGAAVKWYALDVFVEDCQRAREWGVRPRKAWRLPRVVTAREWEELREEVARSRTEMSGRPWTGSRPLGDGAGTPTSAEAGPHPSAGRPSSTSPLVVLAVLLGSLSTLTLWVAATVNAILSRGLRGR